MASPRASPRVDKARCADGPVSPKAAAAANAAAALAGCGDTSSEWQAILAEVSKAVVVLKVRSRLRSRLSLARRNEKRSHAAAEAPGALRAHAARICRASRRPRALVVSLTHRAACSRIR
jgi:hypothetical protein